MAAVKVFKGPAEIKMMKLITVALTEPIYYLLSSSSTPTFYKLEDGVSLVNPILKDAHLGAARTILRSPSGELWFSSPALTLALADDIEVASDVDCDDVISTMPTFDRLHRLLDRPLAILRVASRQAGMARAFASSSTGHTRLLSDELLPDDGMDSQWQTGRYVEVNSLYATSVTRRHLEQLSNGSFLDYVHEGLLLDAFGAYGVEDFRSCLMYAAFAAEAAAGKWLTDEYQAMLSSRALHLRVRDVQANNQSPVAQKDDLWEYLVSGTRNICEQLFHLRPLYLVKRSMQIEKQNLYAKINRLFTTRNSIVHSNSSSHAYPYTRESAEVALETVVEVLTWFGLPSDFVLPNKRFFLTDRGLEPSKY